MSIDAKTEHGEFRFRVSEFEKGAYVSAEPLGGPGLSVLPGNTGLFFTLRDDSFENAQRVAAFLNDRVATIGITVFRDHPMFATVRGK
jgi:hypothetical protein